MNQVNARVIKGEFNIFKNINLNYYFITLILGEFTVQAIIIEFGSVALSVSLDGLTAKQWGICIGFALITFLVSIILKVIPLEIPIEKVLTLLSKGKASVLPSDTPSKNKDNEEDSAFPRLIKNIRKPPTMLLEKKQSSKIRTPKIELVN